MWIRWDRKYLKVCLYVILTFAVLYLLKVIIDNIHTIFFHSRTIISEFWSILTPLTWGFVIAYLLYPLVIFFEKRMKPIPEHLPKEVYQKKKKKKRFIATLFTYMLTVLLFGLLINYMVPQLSNSYNKLIEAIPTYMQEFNGYYEKIQSANNVLNKSELPQEVKDVIIQGIQTVSTWASKSIGWIAAILVSFVGNILNIFLAFVISFYIIKDFDFFRKGYNNAKETLLPIKIQVAIGHIFAAINEVLKGFLRSQVLVGFIVGILSTLGLLFLKVDFAVILGGVAGITNIIPYFGPFIGAIPAIIVGIFTGGIKKAIFIGILFTIIQQTESLLITPKIVGNELDLHPLFVIISIVIGGAYFGILGMIIAVPVAALLKKLYHYFLLYLQTRKIGP